MRKLKVLIVDDEPDVAESLDLMVESLGHQGLVTNCPNRALSLLSQTKFDLIFSDIHMSKMNGIKLMETHFQQVEKGVTGEHSDFHVPWVFVTGDASPDLIETTIKKGASYFVTKPFDQQVIKITIEKAIEKNSSPISEIQHIVSSLSGVRFGENRAQLIETRILRRVGKLKLDSINEYFEYFKKHRKEEVDYMVSALTTHTTQFFRESDHFDYLFDHVFPTFLEKKEPILLWSAASSTGEEIYSMVISFIEFCRNHKVNMNKLPEVKFIGSDIDFESVKKAESGIYHKSSVEKIPRYLVDRYFEKGHDDYQDYYRVKDFVRKFAKFRQGNLMSRSSWPSEKFDIIFARNVFIYFSQEDITAIAKKMVGNLKLDSYLFLGHSESLRGLNVPYIMSAPAVYQLDKPGRSSVVASKSIEQPQSNSISPVTVAPKRVLIVDDSPTIRRMLKKLISLDAELEVVGEVNDPIAAKDFLKTNKADVMTLDLHMPNMDGVTYLRSCNSSHIPVVVISAVKEEEANEIFNISNRVAFDFIQKPTALDITEIGEKICETLKAAVRSREKISTSSQSSIEFDFKDLEEKDLIVIGSSTGGVQAVEEILAKLPANSPPILVTQHIPPVFSNAFAKRLNSTCAIKVKEAENGDFIERGTAYIAPGGLQMALKKLKSNIKIKVVDEGKYHGFIPSVDYLFESVAKFSKDYNITAVLLTGMGKDGAIGMKKLFDTGVYTIAESEETCVVFGMPAAAIKLGGAKEVLPLYDIAENIFKANKKVNKKAS